MEIAPNLVTDEFKIFEDPAPPSPIAPEHQVAPSNDGVGLGAIYGSDNRIEVSAIDDEARRNLAQAVCGIFDGPRIAVNASTYEVRPASTLRAQLAAKFPSTPLDPLVRFADQPVAACGSGALIDSRHIITSAHTFFNADGTEKRDPTQTWIAFGWTQASGNEMLASNVFKGKRVVAWAYDADKGRGSSDWAIIELGKPDDPSKSAISNLPTMPLSVEDAPMNAPLWMVGHPCGLPQKYATGKVTDRNTLSFSTNLDAFEANSGSPVFNATNQLVGILMSGPDADYTVIGGKVIEADYNEYNPTRVCKTQPVYSAFTASYTVQFSVGSDIFADSTDDLNLSLNIFHQTNDTSSPGIFGWGRNTSYERDVEYTEGPGFPTTFTFEKRPSRFWTDDLQLESIKLLRGGVSVHQYLGGWLTSTEPRMQFALSNRYTL